MDLYAVMTEIDTRLKTITGLRVAEFGYAAEIKPPCAVQYPPDRITFDETYGRGLDQYEDHLIVVFVALGARRRSAMKELAPYLAGSGVQSIKAKVDTVGGAYTACSDVQVQWAEPAIVKINGVDHLAGLFHCKINGPGA